MDRELGEGHHAYWYPGLCEKKPEKKKENPRNFGIYISPELANLMRKNNL